MMWWIVFSFWVGVIVGVFAMSLMATARSDE